MTTRPRLAVAGGAALTFAAVAGAAIGQAPPALTARCSIVSQAADTIAERSILDKTIGAMGSGFSSITDQFSVSGKNGPYACTPPIIARHAIDLAKQKANAEAIKAGDTRVIDFAGQADVAGTMRSDLLAMPQTEARLQAIVDEIARAWPYRGMKPVKVLMVGSLDYNAFANADHTIAVSVGVFAGPDGGVAEDLTDSDLYFLLGHEYTHLALDHFRSQEAGEQQRRFIGNTLRVAEKGVMLASSINYAQAAPNLPVDLKASYDEAQESSRHLRFLMDRGVFPVFGRGHEDESDAAGMDAAFLSGRFPRYGYSVDQFEATEKTMQQRMETAQANMTTRADKVLKDPRFESAIKGGDMAGSFGAIVDTLKKSVYESIRKLMIEVSGRNHRSAKARRDGIGKYQKAAYVKAGLLPENVELATTQTNQLRGLKELSAGLAAIRAITAAEDALVALPSDKAKAQAQIDIALKGPFGAEPYVRYVAHLVALAKGETARAILHLEEARKRPNASPLVYRELIRLYATTGRVPMAKAVLANRPPRFRDKAYFLPSEILIQVRSRQYETAQKTMADCKATNRDAIILDCKSAALDVNFKETPPQEQQKLKGFATWAPSVPEAAKTPGRIPPRIPNIPIPWRPG